MGLFSHCLSDEMELDFVVPPSHYIPAATSPLVILVGRYYLRSIRGHDESSGRRARRAVPPMPAHDGLCSPG